MGKLKYPTLGHQISIWAGKCYVFVRRSVNVNLTEIDQNDFSDGEIYSGV